MPSSLPPRFPRVLLFLPLLLVAASAHAQRVTLDLDGIWEIADSVEAEAMPATFEHTVPVPGLVHNATPPFPDVDAFDSVELISNRIRSAHLADRLPESARVAPPGVSRQKRNYFWYRRTFSAPSGKSVATLRVNKAQFGTAVWLNGRRIGEHAGCFTAGIFDMTPAIEWESENTLVVRVGAHPGVLPPTYPAGTDFEKLRWTPGIYDEVSAHFSDNPVVEWVQVAPRIATSEILVETKLSNHTDTPVVLDLVHEVRPWKAREPVAGNVGEAITLKPRETRAVRGTLSIPDAHLWSPEDPFLYELLTSTGGDSTVTRFGMREFRFDTATRRAWLNGRVYFMRGSNITLHRFFEDPMSGQLPWDEAWVRRLLVDIPREMHWNSFRFCIGPVPDRWLEIADEAGLLIQNEFFVWTGAPEWDRGYARHWDPEEMVRQYSDWLRDNWNHPSVAIWDANNESRDPLFAETIIPAVRPLDRSHRPWENSYNQPVGPDDPIEDHPYLYSGYLWGPPFTLTDLEERTGSPKSPPRAARAMILNEYGWLWLRRDGKPTVLTQRVYDDLLGPDATAEKRFELNAYLLAALTEHWRAYRNYAAVLHFVYLTSSFPGVFTADHFQDVEALILEPHLEDYMGEAMKPLGVYVNFFQPTLAAGRAQSYRIMMVNDSYAEEQGELALTLETQGGREVARVTTPFSIAPLGALSRDLELETPEALGAYLLKATATTGGGSTVSRRKLVVSAE
jgi:beta-galactosidase